jgi:hypothetical protein
MWIQLSLAYGSDCCPWLFPGCWEKQLPMRLRSYAYVGDVCQCQGAKIRRDRFIERLKLY